MASKKGGSIGVAFFVASYFFRRPPVFGQEFFADMK
jgi:hypothetical protein